MSYELSVRRRAGADRPIRFPRSRTPSRGSRRKDSSIISTVSKELDNLESLYEIDSGVYEENNASGDVVNMTTFCVS